MYANSVIAHLVRNFDCDQEYAEMAVEVHSEAVTKGKKAPMQAYDVARQIAAVEGFKPRAIESVEIVSIV